MRFRAIYRASIYLMLVLASLVLTHDSAATDEPWPLLHPLAVALAAVLAWRTADRDPRRALSRSTANSLAYASVVVVLVEIWADVNLALAMGYWLIYIGIIKMFLPKTIEDDWYLFLVSLVQVVIGAFLGQSDRTGMLLLAWALTTLWALGLFHLRREDERTSPGPSADPYPGLIDRPFLFASGRVAATTLALGGLIFLAMPRWDGPASRPRMTPAGQTLSGFSTEVRLGQMGEILTNDAVVMGVKTYTIKGEPEQLDPEKLEGPLWRGLALVNYQDGVWSRSDVLMLGRAPRQSRSTSEKIVQQIKLQPTNTPVLFALRPVLELSTRGEYTQIGLADGSLQRSESHVGQGMEYKVVSERLQDVEATQPSEFNPWNRRLHGTTLIRELLAIPGNDRGLRRKLRGLAETVVRDIPERDIRSRAQALEQYLGSTGGFTYSIQMTRSGPPSQIDPVEDFLFNRKQGHCEYFASALTLLLRSVNIPARVVNGFKGGDWNELGQVLHVRQKHAHSWVEALVSTEPEGPARWLTLDPTPPAQREAAVAGVGGPAKGFRPFLDYLRYLWIFYVVGFNAERQERLIYGPVRDLVDLAILGVKMYWALARQALHGLVVVRDVRSFFSVGGFFASTLILLIAAGLFLVGRLIYRRFWWAYRREDESDRPVVSFYRRLIDVLAAVGVQRPPAETPREFARRAGLFLSGRDTEGRGLSEVPALVVDAFYGVRFGLRELGPEEVRDLESRLDALESTLRPPKRRPGGDVQHSS